MLREQEERLAKSADKAIARLAPVFEDALRGRNIRFEKELKNQSLVYFSTTVGEGDFAIKVTAWIDHDVNRGEWSSSLTGYAQIVVDGFQGAKTVTYRPKNGVVNVGKAADLYAKRIEDAKRISEQLKTDTMARISNRNAEDEELAVLGKIPKNVYPNREVSGLYRVEINRAVSYSTLAKILELIRAEDGEQEEDEE